MIAFLVTISGISVAGIGSAFWGLVAGVAANMLLTGRIRSKERQEGQEGQEGRTKNRKLPRCLRFSFVFKWIVKPGACRLPPTPLFLATVSS
ncbi:hypothetical protein ACFSO0_01730 [Brevibacillus sp. GCM10020057]|uniref:hypothetical protein n=1 Tax=Brevibacillus sp. GCM10020057 TaxID=3317327 RepID=UPI00364309C7